MKVKELIKLLKGLNPDNEIVLSSDEEGNNYGQIDKSWGEEVNKKKENIYILYPCNPVTGDDLFLL